VCKYRSGTKSDANSRRSVTRRNVARRTYPNGTLRARRRGNSRPRRPSTVVGAEMKRRRLTPFWRPGYGRARIVCLRTPPPTFTGRRVTAALRGRDASVALKNKTRYSASAVAYGSARTNTVKAINVPRPWITVATRRVSFMRPYYW